MEKKHREIYFALILGIAVPGVLFSMLTLRPEPAEPPGADSVEPTMAQNLQQKPEETTAQTDPVPKQQIAVLMDDGQARIMDLDEYISGVVAAEMPAEFEEDALRAQAVAARTYALKRAEGSKHTGGAVCTDSACCQAYRVQWQTEAGSDKIRTAVDSTAGQVLTYGGQLIDATYFSCSGGKTEAAVAVWGTDVPYLQAVDSPGEEQATHYMDTVSFSLETFSQKIGDKLTDGWLGKITYTPGGGVDTIQIGGKTYTGTQLRSKLGLRSTAFVITGIGDKVTITTKGFGHRVGMSQYGADAMAVQGKNYQQILSYYYPGTALEVYAPD